MKQEKHRTLRELLNGFSQSVLDQIQNLDSPVQKLTADSREVGPGAVFVAIRGTQQDGHRFISSVAQSGILLIVGEEPKPSDLQIPYLQVPDSRKALGQMASNFFGNPSHSLLVIGITGTSGKTTTTYLVESILTAANQKVGVIGTINSRYGKIILPSQLTTPGPVELQQLLAQMKKSGCTAVVMEVSSHALKQHRVASIAFDAMVFTNLSPEHLDFHPDMEDYFAAKKLLFTEYAQLSLQNGKHPVAVINQDDDYGKRLLKNLGTESGLKVISYGIQENPDISGKNLRVTSAGIQGKVGSLTLHSPLTGSFNVLNLLAALSVAKGLGLQTRSMTEGIASLSGVPGRMERVPNQKGIHVLVDYAHKPDALEKVLNGLRGLRDSHRLITVFGCGGDRDRNKRPVMGSLAVTLSDHVFITSDNPRTENPQTIIDEILKGTKAHSNFTVEADRKKAIHQAIQFSKPGDIVLIAGKGHEDYQIIADPTQPSGTRKIHFDDREVAASSLCIQKVADGKEF